MTDLIQNPAYTPSFEEITAYINPPAREIWQDLNAYIQNTFHASPKITFSVCAGKPGWNVKYQKSGKSICTLYPEKDRLIALVVIKTELGEILLKANPAPHPLIRDLIASGKHFNNTYWLMVPLTECDVLESVKDLLVLKRTC